MADGRDLLRPLAQQRQAIEADLRASAGGGSAADLRAINESASAWVLATVLVRFCEDNQLIDAPFLAGPEGRLSLARDRQLAYFQRHPEQGDREWIVAGLDSLSTSPATIRLFDGLHAMMRRHPISPYAATDLVAFWRRVDDTGQLIHNFRDPGLGTDFLADVYQDLSEFDRRTYALVQTPSFVADLILDRTVKPAIGLFGLPDLRIIDPVSGSGTFLLGAFDRVLDGWRQAEPDGLSWDQIRQALASIHGVDKNPIAVVICRFRLLMAAMKAADALCLSEVPELPLMIEHGDSLIPSCSGAPDNLLGSGSYHVVVGNPPYITVKDPADHELYRSLYSVCRGKYPLAVPFIARFFELAQSSTDGAGFVGLLVSNSFMKREFGRPLIEDFLAKIDLTHVLDTSGAFIPGHGTPTVILFGRARAPVGRVVRAALGIRGESEQPVNPADGVVWTALTAQIDQPGSESEWIQAADIDRQRFARHPWSLAGSSADDLLSTVEAGRSRLEPTGNAYRLLRRHRSRRSLYRACPGVPARRRGTRGDGPHHQRFGGPRLGRGSTGVRLLPWSRRSGRRGHHELPAPSSSTLAIPNYAWRTPGYWHQADHGGWASLVQLASDHLYPRRAPLVTCISLGRHPCTLRRVAWWRGATAFGARRQAAGWYVRR